MDEQKCFHFARLNLFVTAAFALLERIKMPASRSVFVLGLFAGGIYLGESLASLSVLISANTVFGGWRNLFVFVGIVSIILGLMIFVLMRRMDFGSSEESIHIVLSNNSDNKENAQHHFFRNPGYILNLLGSSARNIGGYGKTF